MASLIAAANLRACAPAGPSNRARDAEQPKVEQLSDQLERWLHSAEALENPPLLDRRERDLGGSRRSLNPQARCGSA